MSMALSLRRSHHARSACQESRRAHGSFDSRGGTTIEVPRACCDNVVHEARELGVTQPFDTEPNDRRPCGVRRRKQGVEVRVNRHDDSARGARKREQLDIVSAREPDICRVPDVVTKRAEQGHCATR